MNSKVSNIIKAAELHLKPQSAMIAVPGAPASATQPSRHGDHNNPTIELHRSGDVVEAIEVTCGCGQTIVIECVYE